MWSVGKQLAASVWGEGSSEWLDEIESIIMNDEGLYLEYESIKRRHWSVKETAASLEGVVEMAAELSAEWTGSKPNPREIEQIAYALAHEIEEEDEMEESRRRRSRRAPSRRRNESRRRRLINEEQFDGNRAKELRLQSEELAKELIDDTQPDTYDDLMDYVWQSADGSENVIYTYKAWDLCYHAREQIRDIYDEAEQQMEDTEGFSSATSLDEVITRLAFWIEYTALMRGITDDLGITSDDDLDEYLNRGMYADEDMGESMFRRRAPRRRRIESRRRAPRRRR